MTHSSSNTRETVQVWADLGATLVSVSDELRQLSTQCTALQWSISTLLEKVNHPDLGAEIHMLQDVDRIQQTLADLASILAVAGTAGAGTALDFDAIGVAIRLESLRQRLGFSNATSEFGNELPDGHVTWL